MSGNKVVYKLWWVGYMTFTANIGVTKVQGFKQYSLALSGNELLYFGGPVEELYDRG